MLPGLSNNERRFFLGIKGGKITYRPGGDTEPEIYDNFEGELKSISKREVPINNTPTLFYDFTFVNSGHTYVLSIPVSSGIARSIILCLASVPNFRGTVIKVSPYLTKDGNFTNVSVYANGEKTRWVVEKIPDIKKVQVGSKEVVDDSERLALVESYVTVINDRIQKIVDPESGEVQAPVVDIDDGDLPAELG